MGKSCRLTLEVFTTFKTKYEQVYPTDIRRRFAKLECSMLHAGTIQLRIGGTVNQPGQVLKGTGIGTTSIYDLT